MSILMFLKSGIDIDFMEGQACIHKACHWGHVRQLRMLISMGCNLDLMDDSGKTGLLLAANAGQYDAVQALINASILY